MSVILAGPAIRQQQARGCDAVFASLSGMGGMGRKRLAPLPGSRGSSPSMNSFHGLRRGGATEKTDFCRSGEMT